MYELGSRCCQSQNAGLNSGSATFVAVPVVRARKDINSRLKGDQKNRRAVKVDGRLARTVAGKISWELVSREAGPNEVSRRSGHHGDLLDF